jgi:hypothetical protein
MPKGMETESGGMGLKRKMCVGGVTLLFILCTCWAAGEPAARFCATERYAAISALSSRGATLWVVQLEADHDPGIRQVLLSALAKDLVCADGTAYLRTKSSTWATDLSSPDLSMSVGPEWPRVERSRKHAAGKLRPGQVYQLPDSAFALAFARARSGDGDDRDETRALFLVGPRRETLVFSVRYVVITLD